ncbi:MAG: chaperonin GroEL [Rhabdochlamydiaceae bacterium]
MSQVKELIFEEDARLKLREGLSKLADVVGVTLGPTGRHVGLQENWGPPTITSDGYTIVKDLEFKDQFINMGAAIAKEAAAKMKETCGDGTTSTMLLLKAFVENGLKNIGAGASPIELKRGMEKSVEAILKELNQLAKPIAELEEILPIAISSASGNRETGSLIAQALQKVGRTGIVTIEKGETIATYLEMTDGMQFDRGYLSPYFCTNTELLTAEMHDAAVLITDMKVNSIQEVLPLLQAVTSTGRELFIIADDLQGDALSTLVINKLRGTLKVCAVKAPGFGDQRKVLLQDLAILTGATVITEDLGLSLKEATVDVLGSVQKVIVSKDKTTLIGGTGDKVGIQERIKLIDAQLLIEKSTFEKEKLMSRKAQLSGGVAIIRVGGLNELEMQQKKQLFHDSLNSTQAALEEGTVPGGGIALLRTSRALQNLSLKGDESIGLQIVLKACETPFRQIVQNSGCDASVFLEKVLSKTTEWGFNALTEQVEDFTKSGIVDPCKVVKHSLMMALSSAGIILLSEVLMGHAPED